MRIRFTVRRLMILVAMLGTPIAILTERHHRFAGLAARYRAEQEDRVSRSISLPFGSPVPRQTEWWARRWPTGTNAPPGPLGCRSAGHARGRRSRNRCVTGTGPYFARRNSTKTPGRVRYGPCCIDSETGPTISHPSAARGELPGHRLGILPVVPRVRQHDARYSTPGFACCGWP